MGNSTIALVVYIVSVVLMAAVFIYCMCRDFCCKGTRASEFRNLHFTPPAPPPVWQARTETKTEQDGGPWFLVVYDGSELGRTLFAADDILQMDYGGGGWIKIRCKNHNGYDDNEICLSQRERFEFLPASRLGNSFSDELETKKY